MKLYALVTTILTVFKHFQQTLKTYWHRQIFLHMYLCREIIQINFPKNPGLLTLSFNFFSKLPSKNGKYWFTVSYILICIAVQYQVCNLFNNRLIQNTISEKDKHLELHITSKSMNLFLLSNLKSQSTLG